MALTQISTQGIKDGTITNADIGSSAAIARTKLANVDLVDDTSPQLGGNLDTNGNLVIFPDSNGTTNRLLFGTNKFQMYYNSGNSRMQIDNITGDFSIRNQASGGDIDIIAGDDIRIRPQGGENGINLVGNGAVELYHDNSKKFETTSAGVSVTGSVSSSGNISLLDTSALQLGTSNDFTLTHNGTNSVIDNNTGDLIIRGDGDDVKILAEDDIFLRDNDDTTNFIHCINGGAVELYHNGSKKFETFANGITVSSDNAQLEIESSSSGTSTAFGVFKGYRIVADVGRLAELQFINQRDNDVQAEIEVIANGDTNSYFDFKTSNAGLRSLRIHNTGTHLPDNFTANYGNSNDLQIYHDGSNSYIEDAGTGALLIKSNTLYLTGTNAANDLASFVEGGAVSLFHNDSKKFETTSAGVTIQGNTSTTGAFVSTQTGGGVLSDNLSLTDNKKVKLGAGDDLQLYHNGTDSYVSNSTNNLRIGNTHSNNIKFFTNNSVRWNISGDGTFLPDSNNAYDIGTSSYRVRNIYTNDLNLSNEGGANDVDGTWGSYTIQEGAEDLFLINKRSGKKYKFNLTEVS